MKSYKIRVDGGGALLFLFIMLPNLFWAAVPAPDDVLRRESCTPLLDAAGSACQVLFTAALCMLVNKTRKPLGATPLVLASAGCVLAYFIGWGFYYAGFTGLPVILALTLPPLLRVSVFCGGPKKLRGGSSHRGIYRLPPDPRHHELCLTGTTIHFLRGAI